MTSGPNLLAVGPVGPLSPMKIVPGRWGCLHEPSGRCGAHPLPVCCLPAGRGRPGALSLTVESLLSLEASKDRALAAVPQGAPLGRMGVLGYGAPCGGGEARVRCGPRLG